MGSILGIWRIVKRQKRFWGKGSRLSLDISVHPARTVLSQIGWEEPTLPIQKPQQIWVWFDVLSLIPTLLPIKLTQGHQVAVPGSIGRTCETQRAVVASVSWLQPSSGRRHSVHSPAGVSWGLHTKLFSESSGVWAGWQSVRPA